MNLPVDFTIDESALEEVLVTASNVLMETSGSSLSGAIDSATFDALPVGQEYRDLIKLIPGVQYTQDSIRGPSAGGNGQDNTYQFDGVDVSLPLFGTLSTQPSTHDIDPLRNQPLSLLQESRAVLGKRQFAARTENPVPWQLSRRRGIPQHTPDQARPARHPRNRGDITVTRNTPGRDPAYRRADTFMTLFNRLRLRGGAANRAIHALLRSRARISSPACPSRLSRSMPSRMLRTTALGPSGPHAIPWARYCWATRPTT